MKVRIIKCKKPTYWYEKRIGEIFEVKQSDRYKKSYKVIDTCWLIDKSDCEEVNKSSDFSIGEWVKIKGTVWDGMVGQLKKRLIIPFGEYIVDFDKDKNIMLPYQCFEKIIKNKENKMLQIGDEVKIINGSTGYKRTFIGKTAIIEKNAAEASGETVLLKFKDGQRIWWWTKFVTKLNKTTTKKVRITKCGENCMWYRDDVGIVVDVIDRKETFYVTKDGMLINVLDAVVIEEKSKPEELLVPDGVISFYGRSKGIIVEKDIVFYYSKQFERLLVSIAEKTNKKYKFVEVGKNELLINGDIYMYTGGLVNSKCPGMYMIYLNGSMHFYSYTKKLIERVNYNGAKLFKVVEI